MIRVGPDPAGRVAGRAVGVVFFTGFGALWIWLGLVNTGRGSAVSALVVVAVAAALFLAARRLLKAARRVAPPAPDRAVGRVFLAVNAVQWVAVLVAVVWLSSAGLTDYAPAAIAAIVGVHFFPLAWVFRAPVQYATGAALLGLAVWFRADFVPVLFGAGGVLWATAVFQLATGFRLLRERGVSSAAGV